MSSGRAAGGSTGSRRPVASAASSSLTAAPSFSLSAQPPSLSVLCDAAAPFLFSAASLPPLPHCLQAPSLLAALAVAAATSAASSTASSSSSSSTSVSSSSSPASAGSDDLSTLLSRDALLLLSVGVAVALIALFLCCLHRYRSGISTMLPPLEVPIACRSPEDEDEEGEDGGGWAQGVWLTQDFPSATQPLAQDDGEALGEDALLSADVKQDEEQEERGQVEEEAELRPALPAPPV